MIALRKFELFEAAASLLYPPVCTLCGGKTRAGEHLCEQCEAKAMRIVAPFCQQCSEPFEGVLQRFEFRRVATLCKRRFTCENWQPAFRATKRTKTHEMAIYLPSIRQPF
jgi:predicted amidophosphoribosyltransferase